MPREKTMKVVFAFPTTTMAMKMEAAAKAKTAPGRLIRFHGRSAQAAEWPGVHQLQTGRFLSS